MNCRLRKTLGKNKRLFELKTEADVDEDVNVAYARIRWDLSLILPELTMINTAKHVISNTIATNQILLKHRLVPLLVDLLKEEPLEVPVILLSAYTSFENAWDG